MKKVILIAVVLLCSYGVWAQAGCSDNARVIEKLIGLNLPLGSGTGTLYFSDGKLATINDTWYYDGGQLACINNTIYYQGGQLAFINNTWYFSNGVLASINGTWYYSNGQLAFINGTLYSRDGRTVGQISGTPDSAAMAAFVGLI